MNSHAAKITVTATHVVRGQIPITLQDPFVLGPFDQLGHFATPINAIWIYESTSASSTKLIPIERLLNAISRLLDYYPHLTGRLGIDPDNDVRAMARLGTGIHLLEARCSAPLRSFANESLAPGKDFDIFDFPGFGNAFLSPWDMSIEGAQKNPVLTIQRTEFACSAVAIGVRLSHVVSGAGGFLGLYQDLAEIYRASNTATSEQIELTSPPYLLPFMISKMLHMDANEQKTAMVKQPKGYSLHDPNTAATTQPEQKSTEDPLVGRTLRFSPSALAELKSQAVNPESSGSRASTFTALAAHLWQRTHIARLAQVNSGTSTKPPSFSSSTFGTSVNFAPHLDLPQRSFGNTIVTSVIELDSTKLAQAPLWEITEIINGRIRHVSEDETRKLGNWIAAQPRKSDIRLNFQPTPTSFIATGWHRFPLYSGAELDLPPKFASPVPMESLFDGMVLFVEPRACDAGVEVIASMRASTWDFLNRDRKSITTWEQNYIP